MSASGTPLIEVRNLVKYFPITSGIIFQRRIGAVKAVDDVSFDVRRGETLGIVGETGCGKSTTARLIVRLLEATSGTVRFEGEDITKRKGASLKALRREMQMIFQDPYSSLNPRKTVGSIIAEPFAIHGMLTSEGERKKRVQELMDRVGLNPEHYNRYPHEFSGGQRQRIGVARAIALEPKVLVADEPVSALDVSIQAQVLNLLRGLQQEMGLTLVFIAHDLSVVRHMCDRVAVMYLGKIAELGDNDALYRFRRPTRWSTRTAGAGSVSSSPATSPARPIHLERAAFIPAARRHRTCARLRSRCSRTSEPARWPPATSRSRVRRPICSSPRR
jgi:peptide/nickel transport system ATP-binding protein/oligopeptide transport system ATP-binding protein